MNWLIGFEMRETLRSSVILTAFSTSRVAATVKLERTTTRLISCYLDSCSVPAVKESQ